MIKQVDISLAFPLGAYFGKNLVLEVYRQLMNFIYSLSCMCIDCKCNECIMQTSCRYFHLSGHNFTGYPGIIIKNDIFNQSKFNKNDEMKFTFYVIGDCADLIAFIDIFFHDYLNQKICGQFFQLKEAKTTEIESKTVCFKHLFIKTPVEGVDFKLIYNSMVEFYNQEYKTNFNKINNCGKLSNPMRISSELVYFKTRFIRQNGYIGEVNFENEVELESELTLIGFGKYNYIGGGSFEA